MIKFESGQTYEVGFIGDADLKVPVKVTRRTKKSIWVVWEGEETRKKVKIHNEVEFAELGSYSMAPVIRADKPA